MNATTDIQTTTGESLIVAIDHDARRIQLIRDGIIVRSFTYPGFACLTAELNLQGYGIILDAATVAAIQQWANLGQAVNP